MLRLLCFKTTVKLCCLHRNWREKLVYQLLRTVKNYGRAVKTLQFFFCSEFRVYGFCLACQEAKYKKNIRTYKPVSSNHVRKHKFYGVDANILLLICLIERIIAPSIVSWE